MKLILTALLSFTGIFFLTGQNLESCKATLNGDTLVLENNIISRTFLWNEGNLISINIKNKNTGKTWNLKGDVPDTYFIKHEKGSNAHLESVKVQNGLSEPYFLVNVINDVGNYSMKREYKIFPDCPAISFTLYLQGTPSTEWKFDNNNIYENRHLRFINHKVQVMNKEVPTLDRLAFNARHWTFRSVELGCATDRLNNLVQTNEYLSFLNEIRMKGNILIGNDLINGGGFFLLKESPPYENQLSYPGCDFVAYDGIVEVFGLGLEPFDVHAEDWTRCYGVVTGLHDGTELGAMTALRTYEKKLRKHTMDDELIMSNTWGDNSGLSKIGEKFCIEEIEAGARLGLTTFQIDAGWDKTIHHYEGSDMNLSDKRFPNGLKPLVERAKELGMNVGLWMSPGSKSLEYRDLSYKIDKMVHLYKNYGINNFKVDLVNFRTNEDIEDIRGFLDTLMARTDNKLHINLDITTGNRYGFLYFNEYGNFFVENRYTDYRKYYPHWTLRNLWQLSKYVPPEKLQMEFLNKWRNDSIYSPNDPLRPSQIPFDYCFATVMAAQPLAWMEVSMLPEEAFKISGLINKYHKVSFDFHEGTILPIGNMPDGTSWTGFQSIKSDKEGYLLVYREYNNEQEYLIDTYLSEGVKADLKPVLGDGKAVTVRAGEYGRIKLTLSNPFSFAMYHYTIR